MHVILRVVPPINHMVHDNRQLDHHTDYKGKAEVLVGTLILILHVGSNCMFTFDSSKSLLLKDVLHVPNLTKNLLSISQFTTDNNVVLKFAYI